MLPDDFRAPEALQRGMSLSQLPCPAVQGSAIAWALIYVSPWHTVPGHTVACRLPQGFRAPEALLYGMSPSQKYTLGPFKLVQHQTNTVSCQNWLVLRSPGLGALSREA